MAKYRAKIKVSIGTDSPPGAPGVDTFTAIGNRVDVSGPSISAQEIDGTDMDSTLREYVGDLPEGGELVIRGNRNFGEAGQAAVRTAAASTAIRNTKVEWLNPEDDTVVETADFQGVYLSFTADGSSGSMVTYEARIRVSGDITFS